MELSTLIDVVDCSPLSTTDRTSLESSTSENNVFGRSDRDGKGSRITHSMRFEESTISRKQSKMRHSQFLDLGSYTALKGFRGRYLSHIFRGCVVVACYAI